MKPLFLRVLVLLLGSFILVGIVSALVFRWVSGELDPHERHFEALSQRLAQEVVNEFEDGKLRAFAHHLERRFNGRVWIFDEQDNNLGAKPIPQAIISQVERYPQTIYPYQNTAGRFFIFAHEVSSKGNIYKVILTSSRPMFRNKSNFWYLWLPVLSILAGMLFASMLLSFWVLKPIRTIANTTKRISASGLGSKIPPSITKRKDAFGELGREFNQMTDKVKSTMDNQNQLFRDVSHELRSPLARIQVAASLIEQKQGGSCEISRIESEVERLNSMIEDLLTLSKLKNRIDIDKEKVDMRKLAQNVIGNANFEFQQSGQHAVLKMEQDIVILGNSDLLSSMLENVIRNGLRYSPGNEELQVSISHSADDLQILVADKGPGVSEENLEKIFTPFFRGDESRNISEGHHGIGLTLAKTIAEVHGGSICAGKNRFGGLSVSITLPCCARETTF